jgi:hypothetical protein
VFSTIAAIGQAQVEHRITNAVVETRSAAQGLARTIAAVAARGTPAWIGYTLPATPGQQPFCSAVALEPPARFLVLARVAGGRVVKIRTLTPNCEVDAGGMPLVWLTDVKAADSTEWLATFAETVTDNPETVRDLVRPAITAMGLHATEAAPHLIHLVRTTKDRQLRRQAMNWLGQSKDPQALRFFEEVLSSK